MKEACDWYDKASSLPGENFGDIASTLRNAMLILEFTEYSDQARTAIYESLETPRIAVFSGHLIDSPLKTTPRFPVELETEVKRKIRECILQENIRIGYASAACGSDILFHEVLAELGRESHIVLPYDESEFLEDSVLVAGGGEWEERFFRVMKNAEDITTASPHRLDASGLSYEYANQIMLGQSIIHANRLLGKLFPIAVMNKEEDYIPGGTSSSVRQWRKMGYDVRIIDILESPESGITQEYNTQQEVLKNTGPEFAHAEIRAILFADFVEYTKLSESQTLGFVKHYLGQIASLIRSSEHAPMLSNTWGDSLFMIFRNTRDAGIFSLDLCDMIASTDWEALGMRADSNARIALHAGPVYQCIDPVTGIKNYYGSHINWTARLEPITAPGHVYATRQFAAITAYQGVEDFSFDYVGQIPLSKGYGTFPTYHIRRSAD